MITRPLNLEAHIRSRPRGMEWAFWVNVGFVAIFFTLFGSRFVLAPGLAIDLPSAQAESLTMASTNVTLSVPTADMVLFEDVSCNLAQVPERLAQFAKGKKNLSLLVKFDKNIPGADMVFISEAAKRAGFAVTWAAQPKISPADPAKR